MNPNKVDDWKVIKVYNTDFRVSLQNMYNSITKNELWDWMKTFKPDEGNGFMFTTHPNINIISDDVHSDGHSGTTFALAMRIMQDIAINGFSKYMNPKSDKKSDNDEDKKDDLKKSLLSVEVNNPQDCDEEVDPVKAKDNNLEKQLSTCEGNNSQDKNKSDKNPVSDYPFYNQMDKNNKKALDIMLDKGLDASAKHMMDMAGGDYARMRGMFG